LKVLVMLGSVAAVLVASAGLFFCLILPALVEYRLSSNLQERYGLEEEPAVGVSSNFPPDLLLGRIDRIEIRIDRLAREGIVLRDLDIDLEDVDVSVQNLLRGDLEREIRTATLRAEVPEESINEYLRDNNLGLEGGEIDVHPRDVVYQSEDAFFGFPTSVVLDLRVVGPRTVEVIPQEVAVAGFRLPPFLARSVSSGGRTLELSELPLGTELVSVEPSEEAMVVWAER
jgi:hypothetical protein